MTYTYNIQSHYTYNYVINLYNDIYTVVAI